MQTPEFTDAAFRRSHGRAPRGRGSWAFQVSTTARAFDADCVGEVWFAPRVSAREASPEDVERWLALREQDTAGRAGAAKAGDR